MTLDEQLEIIQAAKDGKKVVYDGKIVVSSRHWFNFVDLEYKIIEPPSQTLWTVKTCPSGLEVCDIDDPEDDPQFFTVLHASKDQVMLYGRQVTWQELADDYLQRDGSPCHD